jgi:hypothetical protein
MLSRDQWNEVAQCAAAAKRLFKVKSIMYDVSNQADADQLRSIVDKAIGDKQEAVWNVLTDDAEAASHKKPGWDSV